MKLPLFLLALTTVIAHGELPLSPEGQIQQAAHRYIFETAAPAGNPEFTGKPPHRQLRRITVARSTPPIEASETTDLPLPAGLAPSLQLFRHIEIHGTGMNALDGHVELLPIGEGFGLHHSLRTPTSLRVQLPSIPPGTATPDALFALRIKGTATITHIDLIPAKALPETFDPLPYQNLGYDNPPRAETLALDLAHSLSLNGITEIDRTKWFHIYGEPMRQSEEITHYLKKRNFTPGRQILKISDAFQNYPPVKLTEDPARPSSGWHDPTYFAKKHQSTLYKGIEDRWPRLAFAMCFDNWPQFQAIGTGPHDNFRGTPDSEKFEHAATLAADILENQVTHSGRTATWWEVKNESSIRSEWGYHFASKDTDSWKLLADFHNLVAKKTRARPLLDAVKIGGPASAWMQMQAADFSLWRNQARFMDLTKGNLDFYSHHFYEGADTLGAYLRRDQGYKNYLHGRLTSTLDMFRAHMHATDNVRPILITEMGGLAVGSTQADYWLRLRAMSAFTTQLLARPHQIDLAIPFIFTHVPWRPTSGYAMFIPKKGKHPNSGSLADYEPTPNIHFLELWRDFRGTYLPVETASRTTSAVAALNGSTIHIALTNISCDRVTYNLGKLPENTRALQRRLRYHDGQITFEADHEIDPTTVPLDAEETTIITLQLPTAPVIQSKRTQSAYYAKQTAASPDTTFTITTPAADKADLVIGLHNKGGIEGILTVSLNGHSYTQDITPWAKNVTDLFEPATFTIDPTHLKETNTITIALPQGHEDVTTITSVHLDITH